MSKELQRGLLSIESIKSMAELSILMDALAMRIRELTHPSEVEIPQELKDRIQSRREAYINGDSELLETTSLLDKLRAEYAKRS